MILLVTVVIFWYYFFLFNFFLCRIGNGGFVTDGVRTQSNFTQNNLTTVNCLSNHLTSFAVLVDVAGVVSNCDINIFKKLLDFCSFI